MQNKNNSGTLFRKKIYFTAPSRSGSSLLETALNCLKDIVIINEPANSYKIDERTTVIDVYNKLEAEALTGSMNQRVNFEGEEVTDTFPNNNITWKNIPVDYSENLNIGIKKSFPSLGNREYHHRFINEWESFSRWFTQNGGKMISLVRNPIYTIFSWKLTFDALKSDTITQCTAWNKIIDKILLTRSISPIFLYEDVIKSPPLVVSKISKYFDVPGTLDKNLPVIKSNTNSLSHYINDRGLQISNINVEKDLETILKHCDSISQQLGYNIKVDANLILHELESENL